jgi:hypothetical protein
VSSVVHRKGSAKAKTGLVPTKDIALVLRPTPVNRYEPPYTETIDRWKDDLYRLGTTQYSAWFSGLLDRCRWTGTRYAIGHAATNTNAPKQERLARRHIQILRERGVTSPVLDAFEAILAEWQTGVDVA